MSAGAVYEYVRERERLRHELKETAKKLATYYADSSLKIEINFLTRKAGKSEPKMSVTEYDVG